MAKLKERYADELLEISEENGTLEKDLEQAILIRDTIKSPEVHTFLINPQVSVSAKRRLFQKAFSEKIAWHLMGFLYIMIRNNHESLIVAALTEYISRVKKSMGIMEAKVVSAKPLTEKHIQSIRTALSEKVNMQVEIETEVDPDVIGGFYVMMDGRIFDATVRSELNVIKEHLKRGVMNDI